MTTIEYYTKNVFGLEKRYILDENIANTVSILTGKVTIDFMDMKALEKLGLSFNEVLPPKK